jgi:hypothetical protein
MYLLAEAFPIARRLRIPLARDQVMLLLAAFNEAFLGLDIYLAHNIDGTVRGYEWIPILFGPMAGVALVIAGLIAWRNRFLANIIGTVIFFLSCVVGVLGSYFHLYRGLLLDAPVGEQITARVLVLAPPLLGPLTFVLVGIIGISAAWQEDPTGSGSLILWGQRRLAMPLSKTRAYFLLAALFILATLLSSVLDHARTDFANPWLWLPTLGGVFAVIVTTSMGALRRLERSDLLTFIAAMLLLMLVGAIGAGLHLQRNLTDLGTILGERFLKGAPMFAPLLFANMGLLGLIILLDPEAKETQ